MTIIVNINLKLELKDFYQGRMLRGDLFKSLDG
jgi:hypothetical protein